MALRDTPPELTGTRARSKAPAGRTVVPYNWADGTGPATTLRPAATSCAATMGPAAADQASSAAHTRSSVTGCPCDSPSSPPRPCVNPPWVRSAGGRREVGLLVARSIVAIPRFAVGKEVVVVLPHRMVLGLSDALHEPGPIDGVADALTDRRRVQRRTVDVELELEHARAQSRLALEHDDEDDTWASGPTASEVARIGDRRARARPRPNADVKAPSPLHGARTTMRSRVGGLPHQRGLRPRTSSDPGCHDTTSKCPPDIEDARIEY